MNRLRLAIVIALAALLTLTAAACGGDDSDQFREDYNAAVDRRSKINTDIGTAAGGASDQSNKAIAKEFNQIADTAEQTRSRLSDLDPPEDAKDEFDKLLSSLETGVEDLRAVAKAARANSPQEANQAVKKLAQTGQEITEAENALKAAVDG
jgi:predicted  nucleic acid-binding Zn-ribbon protein